MMPAVTLRDVAKVIRSKNAGPFEITFDVIMDDVRSYERLKASGALTREKICKLYGVQPEDILTFMFFDPARAFKLTLRRNWPQGGIGERDTFGAQQHIPLMTLELAWPDASE